MNVQHQVNAVGTQNMGEYLDHKKNLLVFHLDNQVEVFLKKSENQHYNIYVLKY